MVLNELHLVVLDLDPSYYVQSLVMVLVLDLGQELVQEMDLALEMVQDEASHLWGL